MHSMNKKMKGKLFGSLSAFLILFILYTFRFSFCCLPPSLASHSLSAIAYECEMIWLQFLLNVLGVFFIVYYFYSPNGLLAFFYFWQNGELMTLYSDNAKWKYHRFNSVRLILFSIIIPMHIAYTCATTISVRFPFFSFFIFVLLLLLSHLNAILFLLSLRWNFPP